MQGRMTVWESYCHGLEGGGLSSSSKWGTGTDKRKTVLNRADLFKSHSVAPINKIDEQVNVQFQTYLSYFCDRCKSIVADVRLLFLLI